MRAWKRLRTSSSGETDVTLCLEYVTETEASSIARALVGTGDLSDGSVAFLTRGGAPDGRYARLRGRRTMALGGTVHEKVTVPVDDFPPCVRDVLEAVSRDATRALSSSSSRDAPDEEDAEKRSATTTTTRPLRLNHALVNVYERTDGIMAHEDGPLYRDCAAILSLGASRAMQFEPKRSSDDHEARTDAAASSTAASSFEVFLPHRSLLVFTGDAYRAYLHSIASGVDCDVKSLGSLNPEDWPDHADVAPRIGRRVSLTMRQVLNVARSLSFLTTGRGR
jgi:alkylated DNA repair protein alkB family protein 6